MNINDGWFDGGLNFSEISNVCPVWHINTGTVFRAVHNNVSKLYKDNTAKTHTGHM